VGENDGFTIPYYPARFVTHCESISSVATSASLFQSDRQSYWAPRRVATGPSPLARAVLLLFARRLYVNYYSSGTVSTRRTRCHLIFLDNSYSHSHQVPLRDDRRSLDAVASTMP
jgi:hypothetical protein